MLEVGEHRAVPPSGHRKPPLIISLFFVTSPTFDSSWSGSSVVASAVLPGPIPHAEQFLKEKAFPDICSEFTALLLLPHFASPRAPLQLPLHHHLSLADQGSPVRAEDLRGELMTHTCSSPVPPPANFLSLLLTQDFALSNGTEQSDPHPASHLCMHFLSHVQVFPTRTTGLSVG